jgi:hypothetical protein
VELRDLEVLLLLVGLVLVAAVLVNFQMAVRLTPQTERRAALAQVMMDRVVAIVRVEVVLAVGFQPVAQRSGQVGLVDLVDRC